jgi:hypothetical protein
MLKLFVRQSDGQPPSVAKPVWASAACPTVDHDVRAECEVSSRGRSALSPSCIGIMAAAGGIAVANLYCNQPMLLDVGIQAAMSGNQSTVLSLAPQVTSRTNTIYMVIHCVGGALGSYTGRLAWHHFGWSETTARELSIAALRSSRASPPGCRRRPA